MIIKRNIQIEGAFQRPLLLDIYGKNDGIRKPLAIFCHGYKGFKDWGCWDLVAKEFVKNDISFLKFNFSHNGGTPEQPMECPDPEAFALNNYTIELDDIQRITDYVTSEDFPLKEEVNLEEISIIGHSRGGGIVTIYATEDSRVNKVISWAGVSDFKARFANKKALAYWKENGVIHILNNRTKQQLPHYYQFYEDFIANEERFTIKNSAVKMNKPHLIIHGTNDPTVTLEEAKALKSWSKAAELKIIEEADHVFGGGHPWEKETLPGHLQTVTETTIKFITN